MALVEIFHTPSIVVGDAAFVSVADNDLWQIVSGPLSVNVYGSGLSYVNGIPAAGFLTGLEIYDAAAGGLCERITGVSLSAAGFGTQVSAFDIQDGARFFLSGDDTIDVAPTSDAHVIEGGAGTDTIHFSGQLAGYVVSSAGATATVTPLAGGGGDLLVDVERLHFDDYSVALDIDGNAGRAYRLYQAAFDRKPDLPGLGYQINDLDHVYSLEQVASNFIASPEFQHTYGSVDNTQFITLLYENVLHREPEPDGLQYHLGEFASGESRAQMLIHFSESPENQANVLGDIQGGIAYTW